MVALDSSEFSSKAFSSALLLVKDDDELILANVISMKKSENLHNQAMKMLQQFEKRVKDSSIRVGVHNLVLESNDAREALCSAVEEKEVDVLVVGTRGLGALRRALLGSVSSYVLQNAKCDVIIAK